MQDLGTLPGDFGSGAIAINDTEQISGVSIGPDGPRAFVWQNGSMNDLNDLIQHTSLHLLFGAAINSEGQVAGIAVDTKTGEMHGYVASPQSHRDSAEDGAEPWFSREDVRQILARLRALNGRPIRFAPRK
jgi:probable HAF family extracellular repeat protein